MIFGNGYDSSLWLMMKSDRKNRKKILEFIGNIPEKLYIEIKEKLSMIDDYRESNRNRVYFHGNCEKDGKLYYYRIDLYNYGLSIGCSIFNGLSYDEIFEINIYPSDNLADVSKEEYVLVGKIEPDKYACDKEISNTICVTGGVLSKTPFRFLELHSDWCEILNVGIFNVNSIPKELDYKTTRVVRRRKRK